MGEPRPVFSCPKCGSHDVTIIYNATTAYYYDGYGNTTDEEIHDQMFEAGECHSCGYGATGWSDEEWLVEEG